MFLKHCQILRKVSNKEYGVRNIRTQASKFQLTIVRKLSFLVVKKTEKKTKKKYLSPFQFLNAYLRHFYPYQNSIFSIDDNFLFIKCNLLLEECQRFYFHCYRFIFRKRNFLFTQKKNRKENKKAEDERIKGK